MKTTLIALTLLPTVAFAAPRNAHHATPTPNPSPVVEVGPSRHELFQTVDHIILLSQGLQKTLDLEKAAHQMTEDGLKKANKENSDLQRRIDNETRDFNATRDKYSVALKKLWWYRLHFFFGWVLFATGLLAGVAIWVLKITGKLGVIAAKL